MVFDSLGIDISWEELGSLIESDGIFKDREAVMEYAESENLNSGEYHVNLGDLLHLILREVRMLAQIKFSPESESTICRVPSGYDISKEEIYFNDPWTGGEITISFDDFSEYCYNMDIIGEINHLTGVLIYDKNVSIEDLNLTPYVYPADRSYKSEED